MERGKKKSFAQKSVRCLIVLADGAKKRKRGANQVPFIWVGEKKEEHNMMWGGARRRKEPGTGNTVASKKNKKRAKARGLGNARFRERGPDNASWEKPSGARREKGLTTKMLTRNCWGKKEE